MLAGGTQPASVASPAVALFDTVESTLVHVAFDQAGRNQVHAARLLGITRNVLRTQLKRHGLLGHADELSEQESLSYPA